MTNLEAMDKITSGILLIAEPFLKDPNFMRTVILLCEHDENGSVGFVLNKNLKHTLDELLPEMEGTQIPVFVGGPVESDRLHFIHSCPNEIPGGLKIAEHIYWGGDFEIAKSLLLNRQIDVLNIRFFVGYSGWASNQLNEELKGKSWITAQANSKLVFHKKTDDVWKDSLKQLGEAYSMMVNFPTDPQLN